MMKLDQHFTERDLSKELYDLIDDSQYDTIIEPSAGAGAFSDLIPSNKRVAFDIDPKTPYTIEVDYLKSRSYVPVNDNILVIGNPPFGYRAQGAIDFFNEAAVYAETIAFIVPRSFNKAYIINQLNSMFHMSTNIVLDEGVFESGTSARCVFQVWERKMFPREKMVLPKDVADFSIVKQGKCFNKDDADWAVRRTGWKNTGEIVDPVNAKPITQFIFLKSNIDKYTLKCNLDSIQQQLYECALETAMAPTFTQGELLKVYNEEF
jgi:hypothetical protein